MTDTKPDVQREISEIATEEIIPMKKIMENAIIIVEDLDPKWKRWTKRIAAYLSLYLFYGMFFWAFLAIAIAGMDDALWTFLGIFLVFAVVLGYFIWRGTEEKHKRQAQRAIDDAAYEARIAREMGGVQHIDDEKVAEEEKKKETDAEISPDH